MIEILIDLIVPVYVGLVSVVSYFVGMWSARRYDKKIKEADDE